MILLEKNMRKPKRKVNEMNEQCNHNLLKIYYRKKKKDDDSQAWKTLDNKYFCDNCKEIIEVR